MNMGKYEQVPHPFIIEPPDDSGRVFNTSERLCFNLILVGKAINYLPYFILAFIELGTIGLGRGRGKYRLINVKDGDKTVYDIDDRQINPGLPKELIISEIFNFENVSEEDIKLRFITHARILDNRDFVVKLDFHILVKTLMRRLHMLYYFHCNEKESLWKHNEIIDKAKEVKIAENTSKWHDWERYSSRQGIRMKMGGLKDTITYRGKIEPFLSIITAGEVLHIGKGTSFGLGKYVIIE
ncbi:CRISPR-associated protein Cas6 [Candidatus Magnetominusculus xianensis]|uniref:CRISPR-associated protein Cas6 n=2 Tax=Candidatus Magnetominusculus xianensis TaxID=1748249 RepID=A0ABR5SID7_9BACT|nr:CRISPR-associated protein Cas6 [Candidatus Magnetominusculus xianensis]